MREPHVASDLEVTVGETVSGRESGGSGYVASSKKMFTENSKLYRRVLENAVKNDEHTFVHTYVVHINYGHHKATNCR